MTELYRPSCGTEGEDFQDFYCRRCVHDKEFRETCVGGCDILFRALLYDVDAADFPAEWQYDAEGHPTCTAFTPEDDAEPSEPTEPEQEAAGQVTLFGG